MFFFSPSLKPIAIGGENKRLVFGLEKFFCMGSYGISIAGARKIIYDQEIELHGQTVCCPSSPFPCFRLWGCRIREIDANEW